MNELETIAVVVGAVAALGAVAAAVWATCETRKAARGVLLAALVSEYGGKEMGDAIACLTNWKRDYPKTRDQPDAFVSVWLVALEMTQSPTVQKRAEDVDQSRRLLSHYLQKIRALCDGGALDKRLTFRALGVYDKPFQGLLDIVEPLDVERRKKMPDTTEGDIADVKALYHFFRSGLPQPK